MNATDDVLDGEPTSPRDNFLLDWGLDTLKQSLPRLADSLQRVLTLATALVGGSFLVKEDTVPNLFRLPAMLLFIGAVAGSLYGTLALSENVRINDPNAIERFKGQVGAHRERWLWNASVALFLGLFVATLGAMMKAVRLVG